MRRQGGAISERRKSQKSLAYTYRRLLDISHRHGSSQPGNYYSRRHISSTSSAGVVSEYAASDHYPSGTTEVYVGRCVPINLAEFFSVPSYSYVGSWADHFVEFSEANNLRTFDEKHVKERCLACRVRMENEGKLRAESDLSVQSKSRSSSKEEKDASDEDSENSGRDENKQKIHVFREVLRLIVNLSSAVASKGTQQEILSLRTRFPWAFQDLCLYSQVMEQLGMFTFRLTIRRFIQALFEGVNYTLIFETADCILGRRSPDNSS